jgi:hypothetical protein
MNLETHAANLGGLIGNLQSLELIIRVYLSKLPGARRHGVSSGVDLFQFAAGTSVDESDLTSWDTLGDLIRKYNEQAAADGSAQLDRKIVEVRDALAHGRISTLDANEPLRLIKFDRPVGGRVRIAYNEIMTEAWFAEQKLRVRKAMDIVMARMPQ